MTGLGAFWMMSRIAWGERYLFALTPFMMIPLACLVSGLIDERSAYMKKSMITLAAAGLCVQILGISINPQTIIDKQVAAGDRGNIQLLSYDPESSLLYLHFKECFTRAEDTWTLLRSGPETFLRGEASDHNDVTDVIRLRTYDFWFLYLYFFKFPVLLIIIPFFLLTGGAVYVGRTLWS
jgi:hypothetical protein